MGQKKKLKAMLVGVPSVLNDNWLEEKKIHDDTVKQVKKAYREKGYEFVQDQDFSDTTNNTTYHRYWTICSLELPVNEI